MPETGRAADAGAPSPETLSPEDLFRRHHNMVFGYFLKRTNRADAEDLTQETFLNAFRGRQRFRGEAHQRTWVLVIAKNVFKNYVRHLKAQKRDAVEVSLDGPSSPGSTLSAPVIASREPGALDEALADERDELLRQALHSLPPRTRQIMRFAFVHGMKYRDIAQALEIEVNTVKSSVFQGKKKLREFLQQRAPELDVNLGDDHGT